MKTIQQVQKRMVFSLASIAEEANIKEGDYIEVDVKEDGSIVLTPVGFHKKSQEYFWSTDWQKMIAESEEALQNGQYKVYKDVDDLIRDLGVQEDDADDNPR
jgi:AbrB family looped-hinge helix DNA binding protein